MSASKPARAVFIGLASFILLFAAYRAVKHARTASSPVPEVTARLEPDRSFSRRLSGGAPEAVGGLSDAAGPTLQETLLAMDEPSRNSLLRKAIRDAGLPCDGVGAVYRAGDGLASWRVVCGETQAYLVGVDPFGGMTVDRLDYFDPLARPIDLQPQPQDRLR